MKLKGVNLGGWLVLEKWITPSLFNGLDAKDETSFCLELGAETERRLKSHWQNWITEEDFKWIAESGLNAIRIPVGHWIFGDIQPYVGSIKHLDWAMEQAERYKLKAVIDLHGAPGSQNGYDHSGLAGKIGWHKAENNIRRSLDTVAKLAERYCGSPALSGIETLNEPGREVPKHYLLDYYAASYELVRNYCKDEVAVIISDAFQPEVWKNEMNDQKYKNLVLDVHLYQCFGDENKKLSLGGHLRKVKEDWLPLIKDARRHKPVIVGEWSLALPPTTYEKMDQPQKHKAKKAYGQAQLEAFGNSNGWFFWTYKTEHASDWNYRYCKEAQLL